MLEALALVNYPIKILSAAKCNLTDRNYEPISVLIEKNTYLEKLVLNYNDFSETAIEQLIQIFFASQTLMELHILGKNLSNSLTDKIDEIYLNYRENMKRLFIEVPSDQAKHIFQA